MSYLYTILAHILGYKPDNSALNQMNWVFRQKLKFSNPYIVAT